MSDDRHTCHFKGIIYLFWKTNNTPHFGKMNMNKPILKHKDFYIASCKNDSICNTINITLGAKFKSLWYWICEKVKKHSGYFDSHYPAFSCVRICKFGIVFILWAIPKITAVIHFSLSYSLTLIWWIYSKIKDNSQICRVW